MRMMKFSEASPPSEQAQTDYEEARGAGIINAAALTPTTEESV